MICKFVAIILTPNCESDGQILNWFSAKTTCSSYAGPLLQYDQSLYSCHAHCPWSVNYDVACQKISALQIFSIMKLGKLGTDEYFINSLNH